MRPFSFSFLAALTLCLSTHSAICRRILLTEPPPVDSIPLEPRILTTAHTPSSTAPPASSYLVTSLPGLNPADFTTPHYAGHVPTTLGDYAATNPDQFFSHLFHPANPDGSTYTGAAIPPLLIWLNGGPACSSMDGLYLENGPFRLSPSSTNSITVNPHSWHRSPAYTLYIDQPVGTGLSYTGTHTYAKNDAEINAAFYGHLRNYLEIHKDVLKRTESSSIPVYFSGESHAGHYIPSMINHILKQNKAAAVKIDVVGAAIGNGWFDPYHQYDVSDFAYGAGLVGMPEKRNLQTMNTECQSQLSQGNYNYRKCFNLMDDVIAATANTDGKKVSSYDTRLWQATCKTCESFPLGHLRVEEYLGNSNKAKRREVLTALNAIKTDDNGLVFRECTDPPYYALAGQDGKGVTNDIVDILDGGVVHMLFFNGMNDIICNHVSNEIALESLGWYGIDAWKAATRSIWNGGGVKTLDRGPAGWMKTKGKLSYLKIAESGHMVPMDQPEIALEMIRELLGGKLSGDKSQNLGTSGTVTCSSSGPSSTPPAVSPGGEESLPCAPAVDSSTTVVWVGFLAVLGCAGMVWWRKRSARALAGKDGKYVRVSTGEQGTATASGDIELT